MISIQLLQDMSSWQPNVWFLLILIVVILLVAAVTAFVVMRLVKGNVPTNQAAPVEPTAPLAPVAAESPDNPKNHPSKEFRNQSVPASAPQTAAEVVATETPRDELINDLSKAAVLVVDDEADLRDFLCEELSEYIRAVYTASNGAEAMKMLQEKENEIDVIVSDVMMPEMNGYELCHYVKTHVEVSHIPVILLTARSDEQSRLMGYKNGADDYLTKPFDVIQLKENINKLLLNRKLTRNLYASHTDEMPDLHRVTISSADEKFLEQFHKAVEDNISNADLNNQMLVEIMGLSRTLMYNKVKALTGLNLKEYVNKVRMDYAKTLIRSGQYSQADVAEKAGFGSARYFSTAFHAYTGLTPTQYKNQAR